MFIAIHALIVVTMCPSIMTHALALRQNPRVVYQEQQACSNMPCKWYPRRGRAHNHCHGKSIVTLGASNDSGGMRLASDFDFGGDLLSSAFNSLNENDKYDAVLTGLCAKVLDGNMKGTSAGRSNEATEEDMDDLVREAVSPLGVMEKPLKLLQEMNDRRVAASPRSISALIDTAATTENVRLMNLATSLSIQNGGLSQFGSLQSTIKQFPTSQAAAQSQLESLPPVPTDNRVSEVSSALSFLALVGSCFLLKAIGPVVLSDASGYNQYWLFTSFGPDTILTSLTVLGVADNFYDAIQALVKLTDFIPNDFLPSKDKLPFGFGTGERSKGVVGGLNRLVTVDTERECQSEAAAFFAAYSLGLPCFAFKPNSLEAAVMIFESMKPKEQDTIYNAAISANILSPGGGGGGGGGTLFKKKPTTILDPLLSNAGILKILIWLMAPVAMEQMKYPQLIASDPREANGLLKRLMEKADKVGMKEDVEQLIMDMNIDSEDDDNNNKSMIIKWAYNEANVLIRTHMNVCEELTQSLAGGASTVGDCVAVLEDW